eukprot:1187866-Rhodomonas_salina.3
MFVATNHTDHKTASTKRMPAKSSASCFLSALSHIATLDRAIMLAIAADVWSGMQAAARCAGMPSDERRVALRLHRP